MSGKREQNETMNTEFPTDDARLHRYFDGELDADGQISVRDALATSREARAKLRALAELRSAMRVAVEVPAISADDLWARIDASLDVELAQSLERSGPSPSAEGAPAASVATASSERRGSSPPASTRLRLVPGGAKVASSSQSAEREPRSGGSASANDGTTRTGETSSHPPARILGVIVGGLALAAAAAVAYLSDHDGRNGPSPRELAVSETEILEVDFGQNSGAIFAIEDDDGNRYAVVWLADVEPKPEVEQ